MSELALGIWDKTTSSGGALYKHLHVSRCRGQLIQTTRLECSSCVRQRRSPCAGLGPQAAGQDMHTSLPCLPGPVFLRTCSLGVNTCNLCRRIFKSRIELSSSDLFIYRVYSGEIFQQPEGFVALFLDEHEEKQNQKPPRVVWGFFSWFLVLFLILFLLGGDICCGFVCLLPLHGCTPHQCLT